MKWVEDEIKTPDGNRLFLRRREAAGTRSEIILLHGFGEHSGRYEALIDHVVERGYSVTSYDQRGHGRSEGLPGHIEHFSEYEADLGEVVSLTKSRYNPARLFLIGHSMGGLVTLRYLAQLSAESQRGISGGVLSAPLIALAVKAPAFKVFIARLCARIAPRIRMNNEINPIVLSRDSEVGRVYAVDPLVHHLISPRWFEEATAAMNEMSESGGKIKLPLLVMHGTADKLASVEATQSLFERICSEDKELVLYPGFYHELFNEPEKQEIYSKVTEWLNARNG